MTDRFADIILVDTGATHSTKDLGTRFGTRVFDFPWCDDFAAARNGSWRQATAD
jgi:hypothetical protein